VKLTDRQARILAWIRTYSDRHGYMPTVREIGAAFGIGSTNGVARHLAALEKKGYLRRAGRYTSRALVLAPPAACAPPSLN
jgi:repressor LexA